jgi:hypothetical protein
VPQPARLMLNFLKSMDHHPTLTIASDVIGSVS